MPTNCRGCGKAIIWGTTPDGKRIPLDPRAPVYRVTHVNRAEGHEPEVAVELVSLEDLLVGVEQVVSGVPGSERALRGRVYMVTHFATCPDASRFSGSQRGTRT